MMDRYTDPVICTLYSINYLNFILYIAEIPLICNDSLKMKYCMLNIYTYCHCYEIAGHLYLIKRHILPYNELHIEIVTWHTLRFST